MGLPEQTKQALLKAIKQADNMLRLAEKSRVPYSVINRFYNGRNDFKNMTLNTFERLFPELAVYFFKDERPKDETALPGDLNLVERKVVRLLREMNEEGKLEAIEALSVLRERYQKDN